MLLRFFKGIQPVLLILIPLLPMLLWVRTLFIPVGINAHTVTMPLYDLVDDAVNSNILLSQFIALLLLVTTAFMLARINTKFILIPARTNLPAVIFLVIASAYPHLHYFHPVIPATLFILLALNRMFDAYKKEKLCYHFFDAALMISLGSLFYAKAGVYILLVWLGMVYLRPFYWRELVFSVIGFALPYVFLLAYYYLFDKDMSIFVCLVKDSFTGEAVQTYLGYPYYLFIGPLILLLLLASIRMIRINQSLKVQVRQFSKVFFWVFAITAALAAFFVDSSGLIIIAAIPAAYLISFYFIVTRSQLAVEVMFFIFLAACVSVQVLVL